MIDAFEELLNKKSRVLIDTSVFRFQGPFSHLAFFGTPTFENMDVRNLREFTELLARYENALSLDNIVVIPEVIEEVTRFERALVKYVNFMHGIQRTRENRHYLYRKPYQRARLSIGDLFEDEETVHPRKGSFFRNKVQPSEQATLYEVAKRHLKTLQNRLNSHLMSVNDPLYVGLRDIVKELSNAHHIKRKSTPDGRYEYEDLFTDEALVSASLYLASIDAEQITIVTQDNDIARLLSTTFKVLCSTESTYQRCQLKERLQETPVEVYHLDGSKQISTDEMNVARFRVHVDTQQERTYRRRVWGIVQQLTEPQTSLVYI